MRTVSHPFFPIGWRCPHDQAWMVLDDVADHVDNWHPDCLSCAAEQLLCNALIKDRDEMLEIASRELATGS